MIIRGAYGCQRAHDSEDLLGVQGYPQPQILTRNAGWDVTSPVDLEDEGSLGCIRKFGHFASPPKP